MTDTQLRTIVEAHETMTVKKPFVIRYYPNHEREYIATRFQYADKMEHVIDSLTAFAPFNENGSAQLLIDIFEARTSTPTFSKASY